MLFRKHVSVKIGDPLLAFLRDPQVPKCMANTGTYVDPKEGRVRSAQIVRTSISEFLANAGFAEFREQRRRLPQVVDVSQLSDQVGRSKQAGIVCRIGM